jgi:hypothetical protein
MSRVCVAGRWVRSRTRGRSMRSDGRQAGLLTTLCWRVSLVALLALALPAPVALATGFTFTTTEPFLINDPCPANYGEQLTGTRTEHLEINVTINGNLFHIHSTQKDQYDLVGMVSGAQYGGGAEFVLDENVAAGVEDTLIETILITRQTNLIPNDDWFLHQMFHVTVNANGVPTASVDNFRFECR